MKGEIKMKMYVLKQSAWGAIAYSVKREAMEKQMQKESKNGRFAGFSIQEVEIPENILKIGYSDFWFYLNKLCRNSEVKLMNAR